MPIQEKRYGGEGRGGPGAVAGTPFRHLRVTRPTGEDLRWLQREGHLEAGLSEQLQNPALSSGVVVLQEQVLVRMSTPRVEPRRGLEWNRVDVLLREQALVTLEPEPLPLVTRALEGLEQREGPVGPDRLLARLADSWVESFALLHASLQQEFEAMEEPGFMSPGGVQGGLGKLRGELTALRRGLEGARECLERLASAEVAQVGPVASAELQASRDRLEKVDGEVEGLRERLGTLGRTAAQHHELGAESPEVLDMAAAMGERRLRRLTLAHAVTALMGGLAVSFGAVAMAWTAGPWLEALGYERAHLLGALAFPIGFVILIVGRGELFTENFFVPVTGVMTGRGTVRELLLLWGSTLGFNLVGGAAFALLASRPGVLADGARLFLVELAEDKVGAPLGAAFMKAVFAGWLMTVLTWLLLASKGSGARLVIIWMVGFLIAAGHFNHVVISAAEIFMGWGLGAHLTLGTWLTANFLPALLGNLVGGVVFVTLLGSLQARSLRKSEEVLRESFAKKREERDEEDSPGPRTPSPSGRGLG